MARVNGSKIQCYTPPRIRTWPTGLDYEWNRRTYWIDFQFRTYVQLPWNICGITSLPTEALFCWSCGLSQGRSECVNTAAAETVLPPSVRRCFSGNFRIARWRQKTIYLSGIAPHTFRIGRKPLTCWGCQEGLVYHWNLFMALIFQVDERWTGCPWTAAVGRQRGHLHEIWREIEGFTKQVSSPIFIFVLIP